MRERDSFWLLLGAGMITALADMAFGLVLSLVNPSAQAVAWQARVFDAVFLVALLLVLAAAVVSAWRHWRQP